MQKVDDDDIRFEDLLDDEPADAPPSTLAELLAHGFPRDGGMAELAALAKLPDPGKRFEALRRGYEQILERQRRSS